MYISQEYISKLANWSVDAFVLDTNNTNNCFFFWSFLLVLDDVYLMSRVAHTCRFRIYAFFDCE